MPASVLKDDQLIRDRCRDSLRPGVVEGTRCWIWSAIPIIQGRRGRKMKDGDGYLTS